MHRNLMLMAYMYVMTTVAPVWYKVWYRPWCSAQSYCPIILFLAHDSP